MPKTHEPDPMIGAVPGVYLLLLAAKRSSVSSVGKLGILEVTAGTYVYAGSARGPGGLEARIARHLRGSKKLHWHIDYLTAVVPVTGIICQPSESPTLEHEWAQALLGSPDSRIPLRGFGSSDCRCSSHLVLFRDGITESALENLVLRRSDEEVRRATSRLVAPAKKIRRAPLGLVAPEKKRRQDGLAFVVPTKRI